MVNAKGLTDGSIVLEYGGDRTRAPARRSPANIAHSRQQLDQIDKIVKRHKPRKGGQLDRLLSEDRAKHGAVVHRADYKRAILSAAAARDARSKREHLDMASELQAGLRFHYSGDIELSAADRLRIRAAVRWHLQQAK